MYFLCNSKTETKMQSAPKSLREALCHDVMDVSVWDVVYIKKSLKNTPATAGHWGLDKMAKLDYDSDSRRILTAIISTLMRYYKIFRTEWVPEVPLLTQRSHGLELTEEQRLGFIWSQAFEMESLRRMRANRRILIPEEDVESAVNNRRTRMIFTMYVDAFMASWHGSEGFRMIYQLPTVSKKFKQFFENTEEDDKYGWLLMLETPTNTTIDFITMLKNY